MPRTSKRSVKHDTIRLERHLKAPPQRVFAAWTDPDARRTWVSPVKGWEHLDEGMDFRVGGREIIHFGPQGDPHYKAEIHYLHIIPEQRILMAGPMYDRDVPVSCSLTTIEFQPDAEGEGTKLVFTEQASFLDGKGTKKDRKAGWERNLDQLDSYLSDERSDER